MRIAAVEEDRFKWWLRPITFLMRRRLGKVPTPVAVMAHRPGIVLGAFLGALPLEAGGVLQPALKRMVSLRAAQMIGCLF